MNCAYCGTPLPAGALFCVECGRSVADAVAPPAPVRPAAVPSPPVRAPHCPQCGSAIDEGDIFCGECGFVLRPMTGAVPVADGGTDRGAEAPDAALEEEADPPAISVAPWENEPVVEEPRTGFLAVEPQPAPPSDPVPQPEPESEPAPRFEPAPEPPPERAPEPDSAPAPAAVPAGSPSPLEDVESTRIVAPRPRGERYVLQFSTGESVVVAGTGLIGRNPSPEPGEYVDELVSIFDVGKSVSKCHVEFGQEAGRFWVADRYSTNGTMIRQPDSPALRCEPGKRYMIARGSRVEIGEQFFVVS